MKTYLTAGLLLVGSLASANPAATTTERFLEELGTKILQLESQYHRLQSCLEDCDAVQHRLGAHIESIQDLYNRHGEALYIGSMAPTRPSTQVYDQAREHVPAADVVPLDSWPSPSAASIDDVLVTPDE